MLGGSLTRCASWQRGCLHERRVGRRGERVERDIVSGAVVVEAVGDVAVAAIVS